MRAGGLTFGIYPLHVAGTPFGVAEGPADDAAKIRSAIADLRGDRRLDARTYLIYTGAWAEKMLARLDEHARTGLLDDVVIGVGDWTETTDQELQLEGWLAFIREVIRRHGEHLSSVQITNEPNLSFMEGSKSYVVEALTRGVVEAGREAARLGLAISVGFGSVPESPVAVPDFWERLQGAADDEFLRTVGFVGHNFYVDVFEEEPLPFAQVAGRVEDILAALRLRLDRLGLAASVPIRVTENGWPTGTNPMTGRVRTEQEQAARLEALVRAVFDLREKYGVSHYVLFGLRDADSKVDDLFHQYGILHDDYSEKPAYASFKTLIRQLGA